MRQQIIVCSRGILHALFEQTNEFLQSVIAVMPQIVTMLKRRRLGGFSAWRYKPYKFIQLKPQTREIVLKFQRHLVGVGEQMPRPRTAQANVCRMFKQVIQAIGRVFATSWHQLGHWGYTGEGLYGWQRPQPTTLGGSSDRRHLFSRHIVCLLLLMFCSTIRLTGFCIGNLSSRWSQGVR